MPSYEFRVIPAPKGAGKKTDLTKGQDAFCAEISDVLTDMGRDGWEFVRAETLPERQRRKGLFSRQTDKQCLVFRRELSAKTEAEPSVAELAPQPVAPRPVSRRLTLVADGNDRDAAPESPRLSVLRLENPVFIPDRQSHRRLADRVPEATDDIPSIPRPKSRILANKTRSLTALERAVAMENQTI